MAWGELFAKMNHDVQTVPILLYHSIADDVSTRFARWTVTPSAFFAQMAFLREEGYVPLTVSDLVDSVACSNMPSRPVVVTFDDGFADMYHNALPVLRRFQIPASLYIATGFIGRTSRWLRRENEGGRRMLAWKQVRELPPAGIECGAHSRSHRPLDTLPLSLARREILQSKVELEDQLARPVRSFAYPHGYYSAKVQQLVKEAGFTSAVGVKHAMSSTTDDVYALARIIVGRETDMHRFHALLCGAGLRVAPERSTLKTGAWRLARRALTAVGRGPSA